MSTTDDPQERPSSIDLTLELERQLDNESLPPPTPSDPERPQSLDQQVLAHIVTNLRSSLAEATRHRDELAKALSQLQAREKDATDTLAHMTDKCSQLQEQLDTANSKAKDDENTISLLRTKVEESRYVIPVLRRDQLTTLLPGGDSCGCNPRAEDKVRCQRHSIFPGLAWHPWQPLNHRSGRRLHRLPARPLAGSMRIGASRLFQIQASQSSMVAHHMAAPVPPPLPSPTMRC